ncbi:MAG TPA: hypothetical protein VMU88_08180 [bacterium]|nr:hypothetical protein [bacterium]
MDKKRMAWGAGLVLVLALLNLWRWMPAFAAHQTTHGPGAPGELDLLFPQGTTAEERTSRRDLFSFAALPAAPSRPKPPAPAAPPPDFPLRLLGVVIQHGHSRALIGKGDQLFEVEAGDDLDGDYRVRGINDQEVSLWDRRSGGEVTLAIADAAGGQP